jgi:hypothetical protein
MEFCSCASVLTSSFWHHSDVLPWSCPPMILSSRDQSNLTTHLPYTFTHMSKIMLYLIWKSNLIVSLILLNHSDFTPMTSFASVYNQNKWTQLCVLDMSGFHVDAVLVCHVTDTVVAAADASSSTLKTLRQLRTLLVHSCVCLATSSTRQHAVVRRWQIRHPS